MPLIFFGLMVERERKREFIAVKRERGILWIEKNDNNFKLYTLRFPIQISRILFYFFVKISAQEISAKAFFWVIRKNV